MKTSINNRTYTSDQVASSLILLRHGQASYTYEEDHGGDIVEGKLTKQGKLGIEESSREIFSVLRKNGHKHVRLISSPKNRCIESAHILHALLEDKAINVELTIDPSLRDVRVIGPSESVEGSYMRREKDMKEGENWFASWMRKAREGMQFYPDEESPLDVQSRVAAKLPKCTGSSTPSILVCHEEVYGAIATELGIQWTYPDYGEVWYIEHKYI